MRIEQTLRQYVVLFRNIKMTGATLVEIRFTTGETNDKSQNT